MAVLSRDAERGRAFALESGAPSARVHTDLADFVADPAIDLVIICSPDRLHFEHAMACIEAGKHVLLEKPMTTELAAAQKLVAAADEHGVQLATGFHLRFHDGHRALRDEVVDGVLGRVRHIRAVWAFSSYDDSNWRASATYGKWWSMGAVGAHCIDLARWFVDDEHEWEDFEVLVDESVWNGPHDETAIVAGRLSNGVTVEVLSSIQFGTYHRVELFGDAGIAVCDSTLGRAGAGSIAIGDRVVPFVVRSPFTAQLESLVASIAAGVPNLSDGRAGERNVADLLRVRDV